MTDEQGSVRDVLNSSGADVVTVEFDAFGNEISMSSPSGAVGYLPSYLGQYTWDGYDHDAATGFYDNNARIYDPASGRWLSQDPLGFDAGDSNLYRYVNNAPTDATDPSGMDYLTTSGNEARWTNRPWTGGGYYSTLGVKSGSDITLSDGWADAIGVPRGQD